jgi:hypothetical protein
LRDAKPLTHIEALELDRIPDHLIVLGLHRVRTFASDAKVR